MATNENEKNETIGASGDLAVIGEGTPNETRVSIQLLQGIYHELTGKTEDVSKSYNEPIQVALPDLVQLNHRVAQCCEQYNIRASNCAVKVFYINDTQETFSSFDRFAAFNAGTTSAVESVLITYNFLVLLPKVEKTQSYTVSVRIASRVAIERNMRNNMPFHMPKILRTMGNRSAVVTVKYVDYAVARSLLNTVDQWFDGLQKADMSSVWKYITKRSHYLPIIARYTVGAFVTYLVVSSSEYFVPASASLNDLAVFLVYGFMSVFAAYRLAHHIGSTAEDSLDEWSQISYLSLTAGDAKMVTEAKRENFVNMVAAIAKFCGALLVSVLAKIIASKIAP